MAHPNDAREIRARIRLLESRNGSHSNQREILKLNRELLELLDRRRRKNGA